MSADNVRDIADAKKNSRRKEVLRDWGKMLELPQTVERIVQRGRSTKFSHYTIEFSDGTSVRIGNIDVLCSQTKLSRALSVTLSYHPPPIAREHWGDMVADLVNSGLEVEELGGEEFADVVREWLADYAHKATSDREGCIPRGEPFIADGDLHFTLGKFLIYVKRTQTELPARRDVQDALADVGFERVALNHTPRGGKRTSVSYYRAPVDVLDPSDVLE